MARLLAGGWRESGERPSASPRGAVAARESEAREQVYEHWLAFRNQLGSKCGWGPAGKEEFEQEFTQGSFYVGSPETVARRIAQTVKTLGLDHFDLR